ncbi:MAG TPA: peptidoglycan DD-metalloendopeptidase family protein [Rhodanobacteraceae bacterium]|nr:peptidoglycan DD-metalloendopeptidase family protein [Rhodanobacteraceae bacterium]
MMRAALTRRVARATPGCLRLPALLLALAGLSCLPLFVGTAYADEVPAKTVHIPLSLPPLPTTVVNAPVAPADEWHKVVVAPGQTLSQIFDSLGLGYHDVHRVMSSQRNAAALRKLHPGDELDFLLNDNGTLKALRFDRDDDNRVVLKVSGEGVVENLFKRPVERRTHIAYAEIEGSLFGAGVKAGMNDAMVLELANVFKFDIDFAQDLRPGDRFTVIYDDVWRQGEYLHSGNVIAAEFINQGRRYTAYRFEKPDGGIAYYSEDGRPLQKSFLRTPVDFTRISSRFSAARMHPILGRMRAHKGVDYAAPRGTPIYAAGDGTVEFAGRSRGYGNFVILRHSKHISTAYGHMLRFASHLHKGQHVHQGQVIGYVGMTGLATGPHLHYEFRVDGRQRDPLKVTLPKPDPLTGSTMLAFRRQTAAMVARIHTIDANRLAVVTSTGATAGSD